MQALQQLAAGQRASVAMKDANVGSRRRRKQLGGSDVRSLTRGCDKPKRIGRSKKVRNVEIAVTDSAAQAPLQRPPIVIGKFTCHPRRNPRIMPEMEDMGAMDAIYRVDAAGTLDPG